MSKKSGLEKVAEVKVKETKDMNLLDKVKSGVKKYKVELIAVGVTLGTFVALAMFDKKQRENGAYEPEELEFEEVEENDEEFEEEA